MMKVREPIVDGIFYPAQGTHLLKYLSAQEIIPQNKNAKICLVPHAAYKYSGILAMQTIAEAIGRNIETVVILGPLHRDIDDNVYLPESDIYRTPLGDIEVDTAQIKQLAQNGSKFLINDIPHLDEHSIEVQLPFIQFLYPGAKIVPILLGSTNPSILKMLIHSLQIQFKKKLETTLFIASANLGKGMDNQAFADIISKRGLQHFQEQQNYQDISMSCLFCFEQAFGENLTITEVGYAKSQDDEDSAVHYGGVIYS